MPNRSFSTATALRVGDAVGVDWRTVAIEDFRRALEEVARQPGTEGGDDEILVGRLAWRRVAGERR